jgi:hypothetical protein
MKMGEWGDCGEEIEGFGFVGGGKLGKWEKIVIVVCLVVLAVCVLSLVLAR